ncbi:MAG: GNAT family N-acetyltransferase [Phycisphaerales bacterium]|nr:GNAT family N-acetyltransferase [Phycisphaerales bacterium]
MQTCNQGSKDDITIRSALKTDADVALRLYKEDLKALSSTERLDDGDLRNLNDTYLDDADSGFWIAEYKGDVVGMIGVRAGADHTAEICRLRVQKDHRRRGIGTLLLEQAVTHCRDHGLLKISLDVLSDRRPAIDLFEKTGFRLNREREIADRVLMDFYIDLYQERGG